MKTTRAFVFLLASASLSADQREANAQWVEPLIDSVRGASFSQLSGVTIEMRAFHSDSDYFQARFSILHFLLPGKMHYAVRVNNDASLRRVSDDAIRAIIAHELAHVRYYASGSRLRLLGLVRLTRSGYRRKFERKADLEAVRLGYARGLKEYRQWLYQHVPPKALAEKKRDYLSPEEIDAAVAGLY
jgi:Zn-dependent protease with chaperone function